MDTNNLRSDQEAEPNMDTSNWRGGLKPESRQRIVNKVMDTLKRHLPVSGEEGLDELWKISERFEEKLFTAATSQSDYLRKISSKMLAMETKSQGTMATNLTSSLEMLTLEIMSPDTMANNITFNQVDTTNEMK
ncbi:unnamed protein product [Lathyrus oleraceus]|uniref:Mediator of RNA polymerase II transcription subunit 15a n=1 Tax=Pisum sativum TaxID=3888 RepID=A0A9D4X8P4_PEA|nr:mediator of RNA polymerase II transcription subunit 15a-like [Pisum sativum]KAI5414181.1 Mediator of RNA polymerase II transcription subunit 15a [Pisum sativum]